jgi:hypothetical protein
MRRNTEIGYLVSAAGALTLILSSSIRLVIVNNFTILVMFLGKADYKVVKSNLSRASICVYVVI